MGMSHPIDLYKLISAVAFRAPLRAFIISAIDCGHIMVLVVRVVEVVCISRPITRNFCRSMKTNRRIWCSGLY